MKTKVRVCENCYEGEAMHEVVAGLPDKFLLNLCCKCHEVCLADGWHD